MRNLLDNAVTHATQLITLDLGFDSFERKLTVVVTDDGPGLKRGKNASNFTVQNHFQWRDKTSNNHGIGLFLIDKIVQRMRGNL